MRSALLVALVLALPAAHGFLPAGSAPKSIIAASSSARAAPAVRVWSTSPETITSPFESGVKVREQEAGLFWGWLGFERIVRPGRLFFVHCSVPTPTREHHYLSLA